MKSLGYKLYAFEHTSVHHYIANTLVWHVKIDAS